MAAALLLVLFREIWGWDHNPKQLNNQQRGQHRRLGKAHSARRPGSRASGERETHRGQSWQAASCCPICLDTQCPAINGGPTKWPTLWGKEKQTKWLSFHTCVEAKDTQFVSTQDRLPWLGLQAVKTPSASCEGCQALPALFPIAGARVANTARKKTVSTIVATTKGKNPNFKFT